MHVCMHVHACMYAGRQACMPDCGGKHASMAPCMHCSCMHGQAGMPDCGGMHACPPCMYDCIASQLKSPLLFICTWPSSEVGH